MMAKWLKLGSKVINLDMITRIERYRGGNVRVYFAASQGEAGVYLSSDDQAELVRVLDADAVPMPDEPPPSSGNTVRIEG
jgi:hypothetical protein